MSARDALSPSGTEAFSCNLAERILGRSAKCLPRPHEACQLCCLRSAVRSNGQRGRCLLALTHATNRIVGCARVAEVCFIARWNPTEGVPQMDLVPPSASHVATSLQRPERGHRAGSSTREVTVGCYTGTSATPQIVQLLGYGTSDGSPSWMDRDTNQEQIFPGDSEASFEIRWLSGQLVPNNERSTSVSILLAPYPIQAYFADARLPDKIHWVGDILSKAASRNLSTKAILETVRDFEGPSSSWPTDGWRRSLGDSAVLRLNPRDELLSGMIV